MAHGRVLTLSGISTRILNADYAVRGQIAIECERLKQALKTNPSAYPFTTILPCNIGNPQALSQPPITFYRKCLALMESFDALGGINNASKLSELFGKEVYDRVVHYRNEMGISMGAYSHSQGHYFIRKLVAKFIESRDAIPFSSKQNYQHASMQEGAFLAALKCNPNHIFLSNGASSAIQTVLSLIISGPSVGILIPEPQYPLYSATISLLGGVSVYYPIIEPTDQFDRWKFSIHVLKEKLDHARKKGINVRALCIINPGNPTGNVLSLEELEEIIEFCYHEHLVLLSDEVYQENVWDAHVMFYSARRALFSAALNRNFSLLTSVEIFSFHSTSKGFVGECGKRGGYVQCTNIDEEVLSQLYKISSVSLCSVVDGQIMVGLMVHPPNSENEKVEYGQFHQEISSIRNSLARRALLLYESLNRMEGVVCCRPQGALYLFPRFSFPKPFLQEAESQENMDPDTLYALKLLEATGICAVNGSGFGQAPGTYHLRFTFLPDEGLFPAFTRALEKFHECFMAHYSRL